MGAGLLPNLARLLDGSRWTPLGPVPAGLHSMPWPSFLQGRSTLEHGWYAAKRWNPSAMRLEAKPPESYSPSAFWERLDPRQGRIALLDVPFAPRPPEGFHGICLQGWQNHDQIERYSFPAGLWRDLKSRFGPPIMRRELCAPHGERNLAQVRDDVLASTEQFARICSTILQQEPWRLFLAVFGAPHRIGHYLWDTSQARERSTRNPELRARLEHAREEVYRACDAALGQVLEAAPADSRAATFSLHGMRKETGWCVMLPRLLARIRGVDAPVPDSAGRLFRLKKAIPTALVEKVVWHLPYKISETIVPLWSRNMYNWDQVRCFVVPGGDSNGLIRINLKGRETRGTVEPGAEYDELCLRIEEGLRSFREIETGASVVAQVERLDRDYPGFDVLHTAVPDLVVHWNPLPAYQTSGVTSPQHGEVRWEPGWKIVTGRSGDHSPRGWLAARPSDFPSAGGPLPGDLAELAARILQWCADSGGGQASEGS